MKFYIDPGTGSMLFAILIGIIGALNYLLKTWLVKLRFILSGGKKVEEDSEMTSATGMSSGRFAVNSIRGAWTSLT